MKIAVLDFSCNSVDTIEVDEAFIDEFYEGEVEQFLSGWCGYATSNCQWIASDYLTECFGMDLNSFGGDDDLELSEEDKQRFNIKDQDDEVQ